MTLSHSEITKILPHRSPILLVDSVLDLQPGRQITASLYVDPAWPIFDGHFPAHPVLPGVYLIEAMAQAAGLMLLALPEHTGKLPLLFQVDRMRFQREALPGDTLTLSAAVGIDAGSGVYECKVAAQANGRYTARGTVTLVLK